VPLMVDGRLLRRLRKRLTNRVRDIDQLPSIPVFSSSQLPTCQILTQCTSTHWRGSLISTLSQFKRGTF